MKKPIFFVLCSLAFTACNPINGQLKVTRTFNAHSQDNPYNCTPEDTRPVCGGPILPEQFSVRPGTYSASFDLSSRDTAIFSIKMDQGITRNISLNIPNNNRLPNYSGPISLPRSQSGQPFDLTGSIDTKEHDSAQESGWERCTYTVQEWECDPRGNCRYVPRTYQGNQWVVYHYHFTDTALSVNVVTSAPAASFYGERHLTEKVYDSTGVCR